MSQMTFFYPVACKLAVSGKEGANRDIENRRVVAKQECDGRGMDWGSVISRCKILYREQMNNKVLLYSTGNYIQQLIQ